MEKSDNATTNTNLSVLGFSGRRYFNRRSEL